MQRSLLMAGVITERFQLAGNASELIESVKRLDGRSDKSGPQLRAAVGVMSSRPW